MSIYTKTPQKNKANCKMVKTAEKDSLYEDFMAVPSHLVAEIINGTLVTQPRSAPKHTRTYSRLGIVIGGPFDMGTNGPGGWVIWDEPELHLGDHILVPDLVGWRKERMPKLPETAWFETVPDWVCEIISPSSVHYDRVVKREIYAQQGVKYLWLIDPIAQTLEAFQLEKENWLLIAALGKGDEVAVAPFAEVPFSLSVLWYHESSVEEASE